MSRKSIVQRSIRIVDWSIARTVDGKDDNSVSVSTEDTWTRYMIPKHIASRFDYHEFLFESREAGTREVQKGVPEALEKSGNTTVAASLNRGICVSFAA
jgi:phage terminase large subunit-like protein